MTHVRQQIREAVATLLTGLPTTGANVFPTRILPLEQDVLPCVLVYTNEEEIEAVTMRDGPRRLQRLLNVTVEARAGATSGLDDTLDQIMAEVEAALGAVNWGDLLKVQSLVNVDVNYEQEADQPYGAAVMTWACEYHTAENDAETHLP